jgi:hypothetical protein
MTGIPKTRRPRSDIAFRASEPTPPRQVPENFHSIKPSRRDHFLPYNPWLDIVGDQAVRGYDLHIIHFGGSNYYSVAWIIMVRR